MRCSRCRGTPQASIARNRAYSSSAKRVFMTVHAAIPNQIEQVHNVGAIITLQEERAVMTGGQM